VVNPTIEVTSSTSLFLRWEPPELEDQNGIIIGYVVNVTAVETGMIFQLSSSSSDSSLMASGLRPFTTYICRIAARTAVGVGPYSIAVTAVTQQDGELLKLVNVEKITSLRLYYVIEIHCYVL
jgi:hypothetical protein